MPPSPHEVPVPLYPLKEHQCPSDPPLRTNAPINPAVHHCLPSFPLSTNVPLLSPRTSAPTFPPMNTNAFFVFLTDKCFSLLTSSKNIEHYEHYHCPYILCFSLNCADCSTLYIVLCNSIVLITAHYIVLTKVCIAQTISGY